MGSASKFHGLTGISRRRIKANPAKRDRKNKLNANKSLLVDIQKTLKDTPEIG